MKFEMEDLEGITEEELEELERRTERLISVWKIQNLRGNAAIFHDDQHIGEARRELHARRHPGADLEGLERLRRTPVVDSLEGNMLIHPLTTPIIEVDKENRRARALWWSIGIEGLSRYREKPTAIFSLGMVPGVHIVEDGEWRILWGAWQRTTKNEYHAGWVRSMIPTNTRPPLTPEEDRERMGKYAYRREEVRRPVPEPPSVRTWEEFPDEMDPGWMYVHLRDEEKE